MYKSTIIHLYEGIQAEERWQNHIAHHLLTILALGATPQQLTSHYNRNRLNKLPLPPVDDNVVRSLSDPKVFAQHLGPKQHYTNFLRFFESEISQRGFEAVINAFLFAGDARAEDLLVRLFMGFVHPLIHLGFGVEFGQPTLIAEAFAQAATHENTLKMYFWGAEEKNKLRRARGEKPARIVDLLHAIRANDKLRNAPRWNDYNKIYDGILVRAPQEMIDVASQFWIDGSPTDAKLAQATAEMIDAVAYYTSGAQRPPKQVKFDFFFMHCVNASVFFPTFLKQPWLANEHKARLIEWKVRVDLAIYTSGSAPDILQGEVARYKPKGPPRDERDPWNDIFERALLMDDDGHSAKFVRAIAEGKNFCGKFADSESLKMTPELWDNFGHMAIDSVEDSGATWARSVGFDNAWVNFKDRPQAFL